MTWLMRTPMTVVTALIEMMPRLQAEESIDRATEVGVGAGKWKPSAAQSQLSAWQRIANGGRRPRAVRATPGALSAMGISVVVKDKSNV